jgi:hypothetical protein
MTRRRAIAVAAIFAASFFMLAIGRALGQPDTAPAATPHHAAVTIARPASSLGGQIAPTTAAPSSAQHAGDASGSDHHGNGDGNGGNGGDEGGDGGD